MKTQHKKKSALKKEEIILGIDPGTHRIGYAVLKMDFQKQFKLLDYGTKELKSKSDLKESLFFVQKSIKALLKKYKPNFACIEELFFYKNLKTVVPVLEARGVILLTLYEKNIPVIELTATQIKKGISGSGRANKLQVKRAIELILNLPKLKGLDDSWDAIAIAFVGAKFYAWSNVGFFETVINEKQGSRKIV